MRRALLVVMALALMGCAELRIKLGRDAIAKPDPDVVKQWVCAGDHDRAVQYLAYPEFSWLGQAGRERYLADAYALQFAGRCPCPGKACAVIVPPAPPPTPTPEPPEVRWTP